MNKDDVIKKEKGFKGWLMRKFPEYFNIHVENNIDVSTYPEIGNKLDLIVVEPDTNLTHETLGIPDDRCKEIHDAVVEAVMGSKCKVSAMKLVTKKLKHVNEFYMATLMMENVTRKMSGNPIEMLLGGLLGGMKPDSEE